MSKYLLLSFLLLTGCAHISKDTVALSDEMGPLIQNSRDTHTALLDAYAQSRRERIDEYMQSTWIPTFIQDLAKRGDLYDKTCKAKDSWDSTMVLQGFVLSASAKIAKKRKELTDALDSSLADLRYDLSRHYDILQLSNRTVTDNLKSVDTDRQVNAKIAENAGIKAPERLKQITEKLDKLFQ